MSNNGKGSKSRPYSVPYTDYCNNWDNIFKKKKPVVSFDPNQKIKIRIIPNENK
jgi:hypothetical protein